MLTSEKSENRSAEPEQAASVSAVAVNSASRRRPPRPPLSLANLVMSHSKDYPLMKIEGVWLRERLRPRRIAPTGGVILRSLDDFVLNSNGVCFKAAAQRQPFFNPDFWLIVISTPSDDK